MKKLAVVLATLSFSLTCHNRVHFTHDLTAGYVFKTGHIFKEVYGHGLINTITADWCYYPWEDWGFGAKVSYWRAKGKTAFLKQHTLLQEVPVILYARYMKNIHGWFQPHVSLGGGFAWIKEKNYQGKPHTYRGLGEIETGVSFLLKKYISLNASAGYLFPPQSYHGHTIDVGGVDLRAGFGFQF